MEAKELLKDYTLEVGPYGALDIKDANRVDLAKFLAKFGARTGAEIGVAHGKYSEILMAANPDLTLYGVDPYEAYEGYKDYKLQRTFESLMADAHTRLDRFPNYHFVRKTSMDALADVPNELDFVYIDANHTAPWVAEDIREWSKKVRTGGVVAGHDYARISGAEHRSENRYEVLQSVNKYVEDNHIQLYVWGLNSTADKSLKRDRCRSWMFVKP